jgi:hypothetical protein
MGAAKRVSEVDGITETLDDHRSGSVHLARHKHFAELNLGGDPEDMYDGVDVSCYCKKVDGMSKCGDNEHRSNPEEPSGPRYFHPGAQMKDGSSANLCCKLDWTPWLFSSTGLQYTKQENLARCLRESRPVPSTSCCRLDVGRNRRFGVRINRARSESKFTSMRKQFWKSPPEIGLEDITGGQDYNGRSMTAEEVRVFVEMEAVEGGHMDDKFLCGGSEGSFEELLADTRTCILRQGFTEQCCCDEASVEEASPGRCVKEPARAGEDLSLTEYLPLRFACPDGYVSGTVTEKFHPKCKCNTRCGWD